MAGRKKQSTEAAVREIRRRTRRKFAPGLEESVGAMAVAPGGVLYMSHAPLRRAFAFVAGATSVPPIGGFSKWSATRHDLLIRDAVCAGEDRARNAFAWREVCPDSAEADATQIAELVSQARRAAPAATASGDLTAEEWADMEKELWKVDRKLATGKLDHLDPATQALRRACDILND